MCLFLILCWCSAVVGRCGGPSILRYNSRNSRFGEFISRLGQSKFPFRTGSGICSQRIDFTNCFLVKMALVWGKSKKFPIRREKPRIFALPDGRPRSRQRLRSALLGPDGPVNADRSMPAAGTGGCPLGANYPDWSVWAAERLRRSRAICTIGSSWGKAESWLLS